VGKPESLHAQADGLRVQVVGRRFLPEVLASLRDRPEVAGVETINGKLIITLSCAADTAPLVSLMVQGGAEVEEVSRMRASLEEAFLALMEEGQ
jgi:hypothetical protein